MKNKSVFGSILLISILLMTSCLGENSSENEDYKKIKDEYKEEYADMIPRYGSLHGNLIETYIENSSIITKNNCAHHTGYGYIKDANSHTYACRRCLMVIEEPQPHWDIKAFNLSIKSNVYIYAKLCPVCAGEKVRYQDSPYFEHIITIKNPEEFELFYGVDING